MSDISTITVNNTTYDIKDAVARQHSVPAGGTTDQILKKKSNTDYDVEWATNQSSGGSTWGSISGTLSDQTDLQNALNGKVSKSGDTMSDSLGFNSLSTNINGTAPLSNTYGDEINFKDNTDYQLGRIQTAHYTDGSIGLQLGIKRTNGNNEVNNVFEIKLDSQYNKTYYIHEPANFRSALGLTGIATRPDYIISSVDLIDGVSELESGKLYFYYEA